MQIYDCDIPEAMANELVIVVTELKSGIEPDYRAFEDDETPGIQLTVGTDVDFSDFGWQSGDNSYSGAAYGFPFWGVAGIYPDSDPCDVVEDILSQIVEQF